MQMSIGDKQNERHHSAPEEETLKRELAVRLADVRKRLLDLSQEALANMAGASLGTIKKWAGAVALPGADNLAKLAAAGINPNYLILGEGGPLLNGVDTDGSAYAQIPLYDIQVSAGDGTFIDDERVIGSRAFSRRWLDETLRMKAADLALCVVHGDSMRPTLDDGDLVMVHMKETNVWRDDIYVLREGDTLMVKRLQRIPNNGVMVISDNKGYPPTKIAFGQARDVAVVGRAVWWAHTNVR